VLFHTLVMRDGLLNRMVPWNMRPAARPAPPPPPLAPDPARSAEPGPGAA